MTRKTIIGIWLWALSLLGFAQPFRTHTFSDRVQTLLVHPASQWQDIPVIEYNSDKQIAISFDILDAASEYLTYTISYCNADWTLSHLAQSEYLNGLQNNPIDDYAHSFNTKMDYVNYQFLVPNEQVQVKLSGNYVVSVWDGDGDKLLDACFSVVEPQANVEMQVSSITDKGINTQYQAVSFEIAYGNEVKSPIQDLRVFVQQNSRFDNQAAWVKPLSVRNGVAVYDHNPALIFEGGNEYRTFEMTTIRYNGLGVETVEYHSPYYHTVLKPSAFRNGRSYSYTDDINGRVYIRNTDASDSDIEADYQIVHFYLPCEKKMNENVYLLSQAFHNLLDERSKMDYSLQDKGYIKAVLLKEGYYNFQYVTAKADYSPSISASIEGSYYETENEYRVWVYFRPVGGRYDRLIAVETLQYK